MKVNRFFLFLSAVLFVFSLFGAKTRETVTFHNDVYSMNKSYYPNRQFMKQTIRDMKVLASQTKNRIYSRSASLVAQLRKMYHPYFKIGVGLAGQYEKKWGLAHYQSMNDEWKNKTFKKHRTKVKQIFLLFSGTEKAFNDWSKARNDAIKNKNPQEMAKLFSSANKKLEKEIAYLKKLKQATFKDLADDIEMLGIK